MQRVATARNSMIVEEFEWEDVEKVRLNGVSDNNIMIKYTYPEKNPKPIVKPLLDIRIGKNILDHLEVKKGDRLLMRQATNNIYNYMLVKSSTGYKLSEGTTPTSLRVAFRYAREGLNLFSLTDCKWFPTTKGAIRIILPQIIFDGR